MHKNRPLRYWLIYLFTFPSDVLTWLSVLVIWLLWGRGLEWCEGLWCELKPGSWPARSWYRKRREGAYVVLPEYLHPTYGKWLTWGGTTFGHGGFYGPGKPGKKGIDTRLEFHEHVHTEQSEVGMLMGFVIAVCVCLSLMYVGQFKLAIFLSSAVWSSSSFLNFACGWGVAWLRGEDPYRGSIHEEAAYSLDDQFPESALAESYVKAKNGL